MTSRPTLPAEDDHGRRNDTWIAACCLAYDLPLATLNIKDFTDFAEHEGLTVLTP